MHIFRAPARTHSLTHSHVLNSSSCMNAWTYSLYTYLHRHGAQHNSSYRRSGDCSSHHSMCRMRNTLQCFCPLKNSKATTTTTLFPVRDAIALQFYYYYYIYLAPRVWVEYHNIYMKCSWHTPQPPPCDQHEKERVHHHPRDVLY